MIREIVKIDEELCDGCGVCVPNCHEGALQIIDGKARLISELMCDGLGACIGHCPQGAITIEKREAEPYDEMKTMEYMVTQGKNTVFAHLKHLQDHNETGYLKQALEYIKSNREKMPFSIEEVHELLHGKNQKSAQQTTSVGCPGSAPASFSTAGFTMAQPKEDMASELTHWPVQLHLINPEASYFHGADLLIAAAYWDPKAPVLFTSEDMKQPDFRISSSAISLPGILIPTVDRPDVTISGTMLLLGNTMVNGPGQNFSASL